eukprot:6201491-Pleurochrysis_carterae.AAC.5
MLQAAQRSSAGEHVRTNASVSSKGTSPFLPSLRSLLYTCTQPANFVQRSAAKDELFEHSRER